MADRVQDIADEAHSPAPPRWRGEQCLVPVQRFNERCIDLLCDVAARPKIEAPVLRENAVLWSALDRSARTRVSRTTIVLLDVRFGDEQWWRGVTQVDDEVAAPESPRGELPGDASEVLMYETLMFCWQMVGANAMVARSSFAMSEAVADMIAGLTPKDVRDVATRHHATIGIRWANDCWFWRRVLEAALRADNDEIAVLYRHGKSVHLFGALGRQAS